MLTVLETLFDSNWKRHINMHIQEKFLGQPLFRGGRYIKPSKTLCPICKSSIMHTNFHVHIFPCVTVLYHATIMEKNSDKQRAD